MSSNLVMWFTGKSMVSYEYTLKQVNLTGTLFWKLEIVAVFAGK